MFNIDHLNQVDWFSVLSSGDGPDALAKAEDVPPVLVQKISKIGILSGSKKALFINAFLKENLTPTHSDIIFQQTESHWKEDSHKNIYQMSGLSPALKVGISPDISEIGGQVNLASDVSTKIDGVQVNRPLSTPVSEVAERLVSTLGKDRTIGVKSQVAGLVRTRGELLGVVINPSMTFTTSKIPSNEVLNYVNSQTENGLRRSPAGILWPHPIIEPHITTIDGIDRQNSLFLGKYIDLLQHLLGVPTALSFLVGYLDKNIGVVVGGSENLFGYIDLPSAGLIGNQEKLEGNWKELLKDRNGDWVTLRNARKEDYLQMSDIAIRNFREAPNYAYLQTPEGKSQQEKYITANTPEGIEDLCSKPNNVCNLVVEQNGKILGFRVIRKNDDVADGRRMHTSLDETGRGIGKILLHKSEKIAKQSGCKTMEVHATGESYVWFERNGFKNHGIRPNTISNYYLMIKEL